MRKYLTYCLRIHINKPLKKRLLLNATLGFQAIKSIKSLRANTGSAQNGVRHAPACNYRL